MIGDRKRHHRQHFFCRLRMYSLPTFYLPQSPIHLNPQPTNHWHFVFFTAHSSPVLTCQSTLASLTVAKYIPYMVIVPTVWYYSDYPHFRWTQRCILHGISLFIFCTTEIFRHFLLLGPRRGMIELCSFGRATRKSFARSATSAL